LKRKSTQIQAIGLGFGIIILIAIAVILMAQPNPFPGHSWQKVQSSWIFGGCPPGTVKGYTRCGIKPGEVVDGKNIGSIGSKRSRINCYRQVQ